MTCTFQCGYLRACLITLNKDYHSSNHDEEYEYLIDQFNKYGITIEKRHFKEKLRDFTSALRKAKWNAESKAIYVKMFCRYNWDLLPVIDKKKHSLNIYLACSISHHQEQSKFPVTAISHRPKAKKQKPLTDMTNVPTTLKTPTHTISQPFSIQVDIPISDTPMAGIEKEASKSVFKQLNQQWNKIYSHSFTVVLTKIPEANLSEKLSATNKKQNMRQLHKKVKSSIENGMSSGGKDAATFWY